MMEPIAISIEGDPVGVEYAKETIEPLKEELAEEKIFFVAPSQNPTYLLFAHEGWYEIRSRVDKRPLVKQIEGYTSRSIEKMISNFKHISKWGFTKKLANPSTTIPSDPIQLFIRSGNEEALIPYDLEKNHMEFEHPKSENEEEALSLQFIFENHSGHTLHVSCLYLSRLFGVEVDYLDPPVLKMEKEGPTSKTEGATVSLELPQYIRDFNWEEETVYLKIIASTDPFDVNVYFLPELDEPERHRGFKQKSRGLTNDWTTQLFEFRLKNPYYDPNK